MSEEKLTAAEYFDKIKSLKNENTDEGLDKFYDASLLMLSKYNKTGQTKLVNKLLFVLDTIPKERELVKKGINIFIYKEDVEDFINKVENKDVKIIDLKNFPREIPNELVDIIEDTREIFDKFYVLFTDYTGKEEKKINKERREKDPILFGSFIYDSSPYERLYYLGDWVDQYCDLTLEKILKIQGDQIAKTISTPINREELLLEMERLKEKNTTKGKETVTSLVVSNNFVEKSKIVEFNSKEDDNRSETIDKKPNIIKKITTFLSMK